MPQIPVTTKKKADSFDNRPDKDWLNPISMSKLQRAVMSKPPAQTVELNGHVFSIEYGVMWKSKIFGTEYECVCLRRTDGELVPFGYVSLKRIKDFIFEQDKKK